MELDVDHVLEDLRIVHGRFGGAAGARRLAWTPEWEAARAWLRHRLLEIDGVTVERDVAGNLWATLPGARPEFVIVGSHLDAVPGGGWLDGALGVMAALGVLRVLAEAGAPPPVTLKLVDWADEEGARFGRSVLGSSAVAGTLVADEVRELRDADGTTLADALAACGIDLDAAASPQAGHALDGALAYLELHVEQGPVLLDAGRLAAAVSGTQGDERYLIRFHGQAAHAGSAPMHLRRDTVAAAAAATLDIREVGIRHGGVTTVGGLTSTPGVVTAVAGETELKLDLRHLDAPTLATMLQECLAACRAAAERFGCTVTEQRVFRAAPTPFHPRLIDLAVRAVADAGGGEGPAIPSGPLHDATEIGRLLPTVMVFAQSDPPLSHAPTEDSPEAALRVALDAYARTVGGTIALLADDLSALRDQL